MHQQEVKKIVDKLIKRGIKYLDKADVENFFEVSKRADLQSLAQQLIALDCDVEMYADLFNVTLPDELY